MVASEQPICLIAADVGVLPLRAREHEWWRMRTIGSLDELQTELRAMVERASVGERTLDLIGHSTRDHHFLRFGETPIDMHRPSVARVFEAIRYENLLPQLGVSAVRLLGCSTACKPTGQRTMRRLSRILEVPVLGSTKALCKWHYTVDSFNPKFAHLLVEAPALGASLPTA